MVFKRYINKAINILLFVVFFLFLSLAMYHRMYPEMWLPRYAMLDIVLVTCLGLVVLLFRPILFDKIYLSIMYGIIVFLSILNVTFGKTSGDIFSWSLLAMAGEGIHVALNAATFDWVFNAIALLLLLAFIGSVIGLSYLFKVDKVEHKKLYKKDYWKKLLITTSLFLFSISSYSLALVKTSDKNDTLQTLMLQKHANFKDYGMLSYYLEELQYLTGNVPPIKDEKMLNAFKPNKQDLPYKTDFNGLLKNYNVFNIMIETGDDLMVNETLAPNLYRLINHGVFMDRNASKNKTNISEFIGMTGSAPIAGVNANNDYHLPFAIPEMLHDQGYKTLFFHDVPRQKDIYKRRTLMPKLKFDQSYWHEDMLPNSPSWDWNGSYSLDSEIMPFVTDKIIENKNEPFYAFYTTLSMHGPYVLNENRLPFNKRKLLRFEDEYLKAEAEGKFVNPCKGTVNERCIEWYMMAVMDFDQGLGKMLDALESEGILDNTLFVVYGDHEIYYKGADGIPLNKTLAGTTDMSNYSMYKTFLCFTDFSDKLKNMFVEKTGKNTYDQFTSPYNIAPSVLDLLGQPYNPKFYLGKSLFNPQMKNTQVEYSIELSGFFNDDFWTNSAGSIKRVFDETADKQAFLLEVKNVIEKAALFNHIYVDDYFATHNYNDYNMI